MTNTGAEAPNAGQIEYWNGPVGDRWVAMQAWLDAAFADLTGAALDAAAPVKGERVLDVGCGCGATVLALSGRVGPRGRVLGIDISAPMLGLARRRIAAAGLSQADVLLADAATHAFEPGSADLVFSRFGVMFFDAPAKAFAALRRALTPGGRLVFACWRPFKDNPFFAAPHWAAKPHLPDHEEQSVPPGAPGPFALADPDHTRRILGEAGFSDVAIEPRDSPMRLGGPGEAEQATEFLSRIGPVARALATANEAQRAAANQAICAALAEFEAPDGIAVPARLWFVSARA